MSLWLVRAGRHGEYEKRFLDSNRVYLTWDDLSFNLFEIHQKGKLHNLLLNVYPDCKSGTIRNWTGQIWSFAHEMNKGDRIVLPSKMNREVLHYAEITEPYVFDQNAENPFFHYRSVRWLAKDVPRSWFDPDLLRYFNVRQTICHLKGDKIESRVRAIIEAGGKYDEFGDLWKSQSNDLKRSDKFNTSSAGIRNLVRFGETDTVEFKSKLPPEDIVVQNISAFANANGGILLIGINNDGEIVGLPQEELDSTINKLEKITASLFRFPIEVGHTKIDSKQIAYAVIEKPSPEYLPIMTARGDVYQRRFDKNVRIQPDLMFERKVKRGMIVFVAMSFKEEQEPALVDYFKAMERAVVATRLPLKIIKIDLKEGDYEISQEIMNEIDKSDIVIADFTLSPRNVYFEIGYARGKDKRVIQTARTGTELEFDVRNWRTVFYRNATELESKLIPALVDAYTDMDI
jgi:hypothetical protein